MSRRHRESVDEVEWFFVFISHSRRFVWDMCCHRMGIDEIFCWEKGQNIVVRCVLLTSCILVSDLVDICVIHEWVMNLENGYDCWSSSGWSFFIVGQKPCFGNFDTDLTLSVGNMHVSYVRVITCMRKRLPYLNWRLCGTRAIVLVLSVLRLTSKMIQ